MEEVPCIEERVGCCLHPKVWQGIPRKISVTNVDSWRHNHPGNCKAMERTPSGSPTAADAMYDSVMPSSPFASPTNANFHSLATYNIPNALDFPAVWTRLVPIAPNLFIAHSQGVLPMGCCGSHTWVARRILILTFCRAMRLLSRSRWIRKTKAMSTLLMFFFCWLGLVP